MTRPIRSHATIRRAAVLAALMTVVTAAQVQAQSWLSAQGLTVSAAGPDRIAVGWRPEATEQHYWCAVGAFATAQGLSQTARLARLDTPARFTDPTFSTDPADLREGGSDRLGRSATGLFTFPRGNSLTVGFAASLCDLDHRALADD
jgi:ABC-type Fe3+ transport system permease subunit